MKRTVSWLIGWLIGGVIPFQGSVADAVKTPSETTPYEVKADDTIEALAARFLGNADAAEELLQFNNLTRVEFDANKTAHILAFPGPMRDDAHEEIRIALETLEQAKAVAAPTYAREEFNQVAAMCRRASTSLTRAAYDSTIKNARIARRIGERAIALADERARIHLPLKIVASSGSREATMLGADAWEEHTASELAIGRQLRTAAGSRVLLELPNGNRILLEEASTVEYVGYLFDQRDKTYQGVLRLLSGAISGSAAPLGHSKNKLDLVVGPTRASLDDTWFRVREVGDTFTASWSRPVPVTVGDKLLALRGSKSGYVISAKGSVKPVTLPGDVASFSPVDGAVEAGQQPVVKWPGESGRYQVEIARDNKFVDIVQNKIADGSELVPDVLKVGDYFLRVSAVSEQSVFGFPSEVHALQIVQRLGVEIKVDRPWYTRGEQKIISPHHVISVHAVDEDSSVVAREIRVDEAAFAPIRDGIQLNDAGPRRVVARGVSVEGEPGPEVSASWIVDNEPPTRRVLVNEDPGRGNIVVLSAEDNTKVDRIEVRVDGGDPVRYTAPIRLTAESTTLSFRAIDVVGNASSYKTVTITDE